MTLLAGLPKVDLGPPPTRKRSRLGAVEMLFALATAAHDVSAKRIALPVAVNGVGGGVELEVTFLFADEKVAEEVAEVLRWRSSGKFPRLSHPPAWDTKSLDYVRGLEQRVQRAEAAVHQAQLAQRGAEDHRDRALNTLGLVLQRHKRLSMFSQAFPEAPTRWRNLEVD